MNPSSTAALALSADPDNEAYHYQPSLIAGQYETRFARTPEELQSAQELRYKILYLENQGKPSEEMQRMQREADEWDDIGYHVVVIDRKSPDNKVVGTLRLVSNLRLLQGQTFYTEKAFNLDKLRDHYGKILELSRFCIDPAGRSGSILLMIWKFTMQFITTQKYSLMLGCASFLGADVQQHKQILSYLYQHNLAPDHLMPEPVLDDHITIDSIFEENSDWDKAKKSVPTLLRGYLKIGAKISNAAIIDNIFNTMFVCIYVDAKSMITENHTLVYGQTSSS